MGKVTVTFHEYQEGRLPGVCIMTGTPTATFVAFTTELIGDQTGIEQPTRLSAAVERALNAIDTRRPRNLLLGRIPIAPEQHSALTRNRQISQAVWIGALIVVVVAASARWAWSPAAVAAAILAMAASARQHRTLRRRLPRPSLIHDGTRVVLDNVHDAFIAAVEQRR